jgi:hypothetical protein
MGLAKIGLKHAADMPIIHINIVIIFINVLERGLLFILILYFGLHQKCLRKPRSRQYESVT